MRLIAAVALAAMSAAASGADRGPVIDVHVHAHTLDDYGGGAKVCFNDEPMEFPGVVGFPSRVPAPPFPIEKVVTCAHPVAPAASDEAVRRESKAALARNYVEWSVVSGTLENVRNWDGGLPTHDLLAISFLTEPMRSPQELRKLHAEKKFSAFAEIGAQYRGISLDDPKLEPYFALAEELDIPVGVHLGEGPPGGVHVGGNPDYRVALGHPLQLEPVLVKHPRLRVWVMHYGSPFVDEMIALMYSHPQVYVDVAQNDWGFPRAHFYSQLKRLVDAGFGKRIMFGSDQMIWPRAIDVAIDTIDKAPFLSPAQKRAIFYDNAVRFFGRYSMQ